MTAEAISIRSGERPLDSGASPDQTALARDVAPDGSRGRPERAQRVVVRLPAVAHHDPERAHGASRGIEGRGQWSPGFPLGAPPPLVSVIIPTYNHGRYLRQTVDSVLGQSYAHRDVIVVDDGSTDATDHILRSYGEQIRWIRQERQGVSAARNRGAREGRGELLAFLDADDWWLPRKLERQVARWLREPELGLVHCGESVIDEAGTLQQRRVEGLEGWVAEDLLRYERIVVIAPGSTVLLPRAAFEAIGGFDTQLSTFADWDFCYRIAVRYRIGCVPEALVTVRSHTSSMQRNVRAIEHDMLLAYHKAFRDGGPALRRLRRRCYGHLHMVLAGSFFTTGWRAQGFRHLLKGLWLTPQQSTRVLGYPLRWWSRRRASGMRCLESKGP